MKRVFWLLPGVLAGRSGPDQVPWDAQDLRAGGIGAILSVNDGAACHTEDFTALGMSYRCIPLSDNAPPRDRDLEHCLDALPKAYDYVRSELDRQRAALIHCRSGKDRTGLFMCYFLVRESGMSVDDAIAEVRRVRPIAMSAEGWKDLAVPINLSFVLLSPFYDAAHSIAAAYSSRYYPHSNFRDHRRGSKMLIKEMPLRAVVAEILRRGGSENAEAELVSKHLVDANLAGHDSHGVGMIPKYVEDLQAQLVKPNTRPSLVKDDGAVMVFDGGRGYGRPVAEEAMAAGLARCRDTGVVLLALRRCHHLGRIGAYGEQSIAAGFVSLHFVNVTDHLPLVAPFGGRDARFSTNPICVAVPGTDFTEPVVLDMATSRIAFGKVKVAHNAGKRVPEGSLIDAHGEPTDDPKAMFTDPRGALLPMGEHKGYGLALICDLLGGVLTGGGTMQPDNPRSGGIVNNMLTVIIDPARLVDQAWLNAELDAVVAYMKSSRPGKSGGPVLVAGDPERIARSERQRNGIPMNDTTWEEIVQAAQQVGMGREQVESMLA